MTRTLVHALAAVAALAPVAHAGAQGAAREPRAVQPEIRLDALVSRATALHLGLGAGVAAGPYVRLGAVVAGGPAGRSGADGDVVSSVRAELVARFLFDPFGQFTRGVYAGGGVGVRRDGGGAWNELVLLVGGVELRPRRGVAPAVELGVGGGVRLGVVLRRARPTGR